MGIHQNRLNRIGKTRKMNNGLETTIIKYNSCSDIDVKFVNETIVINRSYQDFVKGKIRCPMIYEFIDDYVKCINPNTNPNVVFLIDLDDLDKVKLKSKFWGAYTNGYITATNLKTSLHRFLMNCPKNMQIDHINRDKTDNRKSNLRICTSYQNCQNVGVKQNNKSGCKGVHFCKTHKKWKVTIKHNCKQISLGYYHNKEEAIDVYKNAAIKYHGEFACL